MIATLKKKFNNLRFRSKLLILLLISGIIPLLLTSGYGYFAFHAQLTRQAYDSLCASNQQAGQNIDDQFSSVLQTMAVLCADTRLMDSLSANYTSDWDYVQAYRYINSTLYKTLSTTTKISNITLYTDNMTLPSDGLFVRHIQDISSNEQEQLKLLSSTPGIAQFHTIHQNIQGENVISIGCTLTFSNPVHPMGYLIIDLKESSLYALYEKQLLQNDTYLLDNKGLIQSCSDKTLLGLPLSTEINNDTLNSLESLAIVPLKQQHSILIGNILSNGWTILTIVPSNTINHQVRMTLLPTLLIFLVCIIFALFLSLKVSSYFSKRFQLISQQVNLIEQSNYQTLPYPDSTDEIGQLMSALAKMATNLKKAIDENYIKEMQRKDAELTLLQSQINPHLLYNALTSITALSLDNRNKEVVSFTQHLSQFYRMSLNRGKRFVTIAEEIEITKHYISIQNTRFQDMFVFHWSVDPSLLDKITLKLTLQPFIENIVNHAVSDISVPLETEITIKKEKENTILFLIQDHGKGIPSKQLSLLLDPERASGYGLINVNDRLKLYFGSNYGVSLQSQEGKGTLAIISIPVCDTAPASMLSQGSQASENRS